MTIKKRLKTPMLTKTAQEMIIQAVVESRMTFNCEMRALQKKDVREMQKIEDHGYHYVGISKKKGPAIKQMEEKQVNMWGVKSLGVRSLQAKIEERLLQCAKDGKHLPYDMSNAWLVCITGDSDT